MDWVERVNRIRGFTQGRHGVTRRLARTSVGAPSDIASLIRARRENRNLLGIKKGAGLGREIRETRG